MKLKIYDNSLNFLKKEKIRLIAGALTLTAIFTMAGCKNKKEEVDIHSINIVDDSFDYHNGEYEYILDVEGIKDHQLKETISNRFELLKVVEEESYNNYSLNGRTTAFFNSNNFIILPECYSLYNENNKFFYMCGLETTKRKLNIKKLQDLNGNNYILIDNSLEFTKDFKIDYTMLPSGYKKIFKGDKIESRTLIFNNEVIAFKQTGVGSECENVLKVGNLDQAIKPVSSIIDKDTEVNLKGAEEIIDNMKQKSLTLYNNK